MPTRGASEGYHYYGIDYEERCTMLEGDKA
jgi:hypothetical protein